MLSSHEIFGFMSPDLAGQILEFTFANDKPLYRGTLNAVAEAKKVRPVFLERRPRLERNQEIIAMLAKPRLELAAAGLLRGWLMKKHKTMLATFLDTLGITHKDGAVEDLPAAMDDAKLNTAIDTILGQYSREEVAAYLNAFYTMNEVSWENLKKILETDPRLQFGA
jgi:hypothetical protein